MDKFQVGDRVATLRAFTSVPEGTKGLVIDDYGSGITIAWDLPDKPIPQVTEDLIAKMMAVDPECPLRDGFANDELCYLKKLPNSHDCRDHAILSDSAKLPFDDSDYMKYKCSMCGAYL